MKPYIELEGFDDVHLDLLAAAAEIVEWLPSIDGQGALLRCHEVAHLVGALLDLDVADGKYGVVEHSWCWLPQSGFPHRLILDPYVPGRTPQVQIVDPLVPGTVAYRPGRARDDVNTRWIKVTAARWMMEQRMSTQRRAV